MQGFFKHDSATTHYDYLLAPGKPVLVLSNSLGTDLSMWSPQMSALTERAAVLRYDTRGHGASSCPPGPYTIGDLGGDILSLMDHLQIDRAHICGLSMGGLIAQWLGSYAPERVRSLVLANTAAKIGTTEGWNERMHTVLHDGMAAIVPGVLERWYTPAFLAANPHIADQTASMLRSTDPKGYAACCGAIRDTDLRDKLPSIHAPTLVIYGTHDSVTTASDAALMHRGVKNSECVALEARHLSNIEADQAFTEAVAGFLRKRIEAES